MTEKCDHWLGTGSDDTGELIASAKETMIEFYMGYFKRWAANPNANRTIADRVLSLRGDDVLKEKYALFTYCPKCGAKLR